ncbi:amidophosphoribosyltransferase [Peptostreptococcus canis]|uniref:Amidophosphoribosyltransferase n=1 Tax=Peptostreptococcus canis TaxID=1159213 RepID=A0ABR6TKU0_9FIRM|nr:amidophosphoribosyltransferase [Peptostreptococcus canis]MBC2575799.1 amidophosphoribosyltransferase [Peptostreptococcus canis]MBP1998086.1 amidophosphoribosyltransferase [Peptostreptococcus canis]
MRDELMSGLGEECGVFGAFDFDGEDVSSYIYYGLFALQHRGQESCGISVTRTFEKGKNVQFHKDLGLVNEVFDKKTLNSLEGNLGVGHVRYSTAGGWGRENSQPFVIHYIKGILSMAHNGNLTNASVLKEELATTGAIFQTNTDSEVIAYLIARERLHTLSIEDAVRSASEKLEGAFSLVVSSPSKLIGARDPFGFRPLCIGRKDNIFFLSSESAAFDTIGAEFIRDVEPGEIVTIMNGEIISNKMRTTKKQASCIFEYIYFARTDSFIDGHSVYKSRITAGGILAKKYPVEADLVVGVPESGLAAAVGYSQESGIPYGMAFYKNSYVGRTFIKPKQNERTSGVQVKLNVIRDVVKGKRIVMVDDSIVRGTTIRNIVKMLKEAGALEVHVRVSSPPFKFPCYYGTDVPSKENLVAVNNTLEEIRESIDAESLGYLEIDDLKDLCPGLSYCDACFSGNYKGGEPIKEEDIGCC